MLELLSFVTWGHTFERFTTTDCTQTHIAHVHGNHTHVAQTTSTSLSEGKCQAAAFNSSLTLKYTETKQHKYRLQYRLSWSFPVVRYWPNYVPVQNITVSQYPSLVKTNLKVSDSPLQLKKYATLYRPMVPILVHWPTVYLEAYFNITNTVHNLSLFY